MPKNDQGRPAASKRTGKPRQASHTRQFAKDWDRLSRSGRYDMVALKEAMILIMANDGPLPARYRDHALMGDWSDHRECHLGGDFLLVYTLDEAGNCVVFTAAGTHADLFE